MGFPERLDRGNTNVTVVVQGRRDQRVRRFRTGKCRQGLDDDEGLFEAFVIELLDQMADSRWIAGSSQKFSSEDAYRFAFVSKELCNRGTDPLPNARERFGHVGSSLFVSDFQRQE